MSRMALGDNAPVASRVRFVEPGNSGQVQIVLEETRQRVLSGDVEDDGIRTLLLRPPGSHRTQASALKRWIF